MDIRLLGPFEVWQGSSRVALGAPKQQALLAQLVIRVGEAVSSEVLIDGLWPEGPPATAPKSIQVYVSNLRRVLSPGSIVTQRHGYGLAVEPDQVDAVRFKRLVAAAQSDLAAGRGDAAAAALRDGLALWRGGALETFRDEIFAIEPITALEELRLTAIELSFRIQVERGRGPEALPELQRAVRDEPLREGLRALLMRALYQAGRQAESLAMYHEGRRLLDDELGLDPSPELQRIERSILLQEGDLLGPRQTRRPIVHDAEQKLATVLVAVPGMLLTDDPERQIVLLDRFGVAVVEEIERTGGTAERLADGGVRGTFGAPAAIEDHANRAVEAASRARARIDATLELELRPRIGLDTGNVVVQSSGDGLLIVGPAASHALRLAELAQPGDVLAGPRAAAAATRFSFGEAREVTVDGRRLRCAPLLEAGPPRSIARRPSQGFVGRSRELQLLTARQRSAEKDKKPSVIVLIGDAGVGKTRIARVAAEHRSRSRRPPRELWGRCVAYGEARTYRPIADMLIRYLGLRESAAGAEILPRLGSRSILGLTFGLDVAGDAHPLTTQDRLHSAWIDLVNELLSERPLVLTFEDLHWADEPLLDLVARLVAEVSGPLFIVATARPEFIDSWNLWGASRPGFAALSLEPLPEADAAQLLQSRSEGLVSGEWRSTVLERADGNPFFLEALVGSLRDAGQLTGEGGDEAPSTRAIPDSIQATIAARIDLLPADLKASLQVASVIGREFSEVALDSVRGSLGLQAANARALRTLEDREFIQPVLEANVAVPRFYTFRHALTREVALMTLPPGRRAKVHAAVAGWLLRRGGGRDEDAPDLAYHLAAAASGSNATFGADHGESASERVALREQAVHWLARAAELATGRYELDAGGRLLRQAIDLSSDPSSSARLWSALARISYLRYDGEGFWSAMEQALRLTTGAAEQAEIYSTLAETTAIRRGMWRRFPAQIRLGEWIERALRLAPERSAARARALVARAWTASPQAPTRARDVREAAVIAAELGDVELRSHVLGEQAREDLAHFRFGAARETISRHLELEALMDDPDEQALTLQQGVANLLSCGAMDEAADAAERLEGLATRLSPHHRVHAIASEVSVRALRGSPSEVLELVPVVLDRALANAETPCVAAPWSMLVCATAAIRVGDRALAADLEARANELKMEGYDAELGAQEIELAILREDIPALTELMRVPLVDRWNGWFLSAIVPPYLDALVALGDRARIERDAQPFLGSESLFEPYARRAVAIAHVDTREIDAAQARFRIQGLPTAAGDTALLRRQFGRAERGRAEAGHGIRVSEAAH